MLVVNGNGAGKQETAAALTATTTAAPAADTTAARPQLNGG